jgi:hypothetical protein
MSFHAPMKLRRELDRIDLETAAWAPRVEHPCQADELTARAPGPGRSADLLARVRAVREQAAAVGIPVIAAVATLREGEIHCVRGDIDAACAALQRAAAELEMTSATDLHTVALALWSDALLARGDVGSALGVCAEGIDLVERDRYKTTAPYLQASYLRRTIALYANGVRAAHELGDDRALIWMELSKSRYLPGQHRDPALAGTVRERAELEDQLTELSKKIDRLSGHGRDATELRHQRRVRYDRLMTLHRRDSRPTAPEPHHLVDRLASDQAVLSYYWLDPTRLMITSITTTGTRSHVVPVPADTLKTLCDFAEKVTGESGAMKSSLDNGDIRRVVARLSPVLLPPAVRDHVAYATRLLISPHRLLHALPFGALRVDGAPLIRSFSIAVVPNLTCLQLPAPPSRPTRVLAVGAVDCHVQLIGEDDVTPEPTRVTPKPLELAEDEASGIADLYRASGVPADTLLGDQIDEDELRRRCADPDTAPTVLHLAMHGANVVSDTPLESWLLLPHSRLDGIDLVRWRLDGGTVVLSACSAGQRAVRGRRMEELPGDDVFGLQTAFFDAGAHQIVGALWPVEGHVAGPLLRTFHEQMRDGACADIALQRAIVTFLDSLGPSSYFYRPLYWAPFYLTSLGKPTRLGDAP